MSYKIVSALASVFAFTTWTYYHLKDEVTNEKVSVLSLTGKPSQRHEEDETNKFQEQLTFTVEVKPECKPAKIILHPNQTDQLLFTSAVMFLSGSFPLGNVFILLLIHTCGADLVAAVSAATLHMFSIGGIIELMFGSITIYSIHKLKREKQKLVKTISELQRELQLMEEDYGDATEPLVEMETKLESWMNQLSYKSKEPRHQVGEEGGDERELLLDFIHQADKISNLQRSIKQLQDVNKQLLDTQNEVKNLLENQKDHLVQRLQDLENEKQKNKEDLQLVEKTITERETFEDKELL